MSEGRRVEVSVYQKAKKGNYCCGDSFFYIETDSEFICALADGLGSGAYAKESSQAVIDIIEENVHTSIERLLELCKEALIGKRGVVLGILKFDFESKRYTFSSIGNIGVMTVSIDSEKKRNIPSSGYLGGHSRPIKVVQEKLRDDMVFIMFSDGVSSRELASSYFLKGDVHQITEAFSMANEQVHSDDTTLIAMKYSDND